MADKKMGWNGPIDYSIASSATEIVAVFPLQNFQTTGFFSMQTQVKTGAVTIAYEVTNVPPGRPVPDDAWDGANITALLTAEAVGWSELIQFPVAGEKMFAKQVRIKITDTSGTGATGDLYMNAQ